MEHPHFQQLAEWIELESVAEARRLVARRQRRHAGDAEKSGETLLNLAIVEIEPSLGGRFLVTLVKRARNQQLPWNRLRSGSPVVLSREDEGEQEERTGVVSARTTNLIQVVVDDWIDGRRFRLDMSPDEITRKRQLAALARATVSTGRHAQLRDIMLGERQPEFRGAPEIDFYAALNPSQQEAVRFALSAQDVAIIHGPPGTGKTTTVVELIRQAVAAGQKVLASGPSNTSVDNLLLRLARAGIRVVRLGHPARVAKELQENTLDAQVERHENMSIVKDMLRETESIYRQLDRYTRSKPARGQRQDLRAEAKRLKADARMLERQAVSHILDRAAVICATTTGDDEHLRDRYFDMAVIDEACQSTEPGCWIPLLRADRLILAGDHFQLPPTVISTVAAQQGFDVSLMQRLANQYGQLVTRRLSVQYRMHAKIMEFSSQKFYDGSLIADASVATHALSDLGSFQRDDLSEEPAVFIDTAGAGWDEELEPDGESKRNPAEARLILRKARELCDAGLDARDIAVIAPYAAQVRMLRDLCRIDDLEIDTVDGFQGREKEAVLITLVRSNREGEIGFLADARRMNVALTRAKRKLIVVGDSATLGTNEFYVSLLEYFESLGSYHTVWEEPS